MAGATHPKVRERSGESYRRMLVERASGSPARSQISFDDTYRDLESLTRLIHSADVVVLPYDSDEQVTSGVLVDAVAAGRPVVSTAFPHAVELLASGAGIVVPQRDPDALAAAIRTVLTDHRRAASMAAEARRLAPGPVVGLGRPALRRTSAPPRVETSGRGVMTTPSLAHLRVDERRHRDVRARRPRRASPRARLLHRRRGPPPGRRRAGSPSPTVQRSSSAGTAFRFLAESQGATGRTRNRRAAGGRWHGRRGVEDCWGRSVWAFGTAARRAPEEWMRRSGRSYFDHGATQRSPHLRAMAFAALGAADVLAIDPRHYSARVLAGRRGRR